MDWQDLKEELDQWHNLGQIAEFWWRDDDAHRLTPQLEKLVELANKYHIPVALAVIPNQIEKSLVEYCRAEPLVRILQHGYDHINHGKGSGRAGELESHRSRDEVYRDIQLGQKKLKQNFPQALDVLVPPWNKIAENYIPNLKSLGIAGLSRFADAQLDLSTDIKEVNCHLDIIKWKKPPYFKGTHKCLQTIVSHLQDKRLGVAEISQPIGILSHHLDHDLESFEFLHRLLRETSKHPAGRWLDPKDIFQ